MAQADNKDSSVVAIYPQHSDAENAIHLLDKSGFNVKKLAIVGKSYHTEDQVVGYYTTGDRMKHWGKTGAFLGWTLGLARGIRLFLNTGRRPGYGRRFRCGMDCGRFGKRSSRRGSKCAGGGAIQRGDHPRRTVR